MPRPDRVAQSVEHRPFKPLVLGSSPSPVIQQRGFRNMCGTGSRPWLALLPCPPIGTAYTAEPRLNTSDTHYPAGDLKPAPDNFHQLGKNLI